MTENCKKKEKETGNYGSHPKEKNSSLILKKGKKKWLVFFCFFCLRSLRLAVGNSLSLPTIIIESVGKYFPIKIKIKKCASLTKVTLHKNSILKKKKNSKKNVKR